MMKIGNSVRGLPPAIRVVSLAAGAINLGTFAVAPYLAVLMVRLHYSTPEIGVVLAANLVMARCFPLLAGLLGDRTKHSYLIVAGLIVRSGGFAFFAVHNTFWWFVLASALVGLGGALYEPSANAAIANQDEESRRRAYSVLNLAQNAGALGGPLVGGLLVAVNTTALFLGSAGVTLALLVVMVPHLPALSTPATTSTVKTSLIRIFTNRQFVRFGVAMGLFWVIDAQFATSLPIYAAHLTGKIELAGTVLIVNGLAGMISLVALRSLFEKRRALVLLTAGFAVVTVTIGAVSIWAVLGWLLACVALYTIGETLIFVSADIYISEIANNQDTGAFFGAHDIFWAAGGTAGYFAGARIAGAADSGARAVWLVLSGVALVGLSLLLADLRRSRRAAAAANAAAATAAAAAAEEQRDADHRAVAPSCAAVLTPAENA
jgi:MFS family permease